MSQKNHFIVLEGLDCSGKTTLSSILASKIPSATVLKFPDRETCTGEILNRFLAKENRRTVTDPHVLHMLFSANRYEKAIFIKEALKSKSVICDRYWISGTAYSAAKGLDVEWCIEVDKMLPQPDYTFFLDVNEKIVSARPGFGKEAYERMCFQKKVYEVYRSKEISKRMIFLDALSSPEDLAEQILAIIGK